MLSSSKGEAKQEARFAARLDVLMERMDTLASTVATTASAIAKKDGEIAALRRDLEARDQTLQSLVAQTRQPVVVPSAAPVDGNELRSLRNAVAALKERVENGSAAQIEDLASGVRVLRERVDELASTSTLALQDGESSSDAARRMESLETELAELKSTVERRAADPERPSDELLTMLAALRSQVEALGGLRTSVSEETLDERFGETDEALAALASRLDALAETVESAASSLSDKEHELAALHRHVTESSARVESIVEDIREALHVFPEPGSTVLDELAARLERVESAERDAADTNDRRASELARKIDHIEGSVAAVAEDVARTKTLWPVALRSLEARLDDAVHARRDAPAGGDTQPRPAASDAPPDDLLAGLRDSLQAMESVAAEMARASETLTDALDDAPRPADEPGPASEMDDEPAAAAAGATIVPLRAGDT